MRGENEMDLTIEDILERRPEIKLNIHRAIQETRGSNNVDVIYSACKDSILDDVGWWAMDKELRTPEAYELVIRYIQDQINRERKSTYCQIEET